MNLGQKVISGLVFVNIGANLLINCSTYSYNSGCAISVTNDRLQNFRSLTHLGTQYNYPEYLDGVASYNRTFASLGKIVVQTS